jgi:hypothetical protein
MAATSDTGPFVHLITWLEDHDVSFEVHDHPLAYTASATAHAEGVSERSFGKVVGVGTADGTKVLAVVDASDRVDPREVGRLPRHRLGDAADGARA